MCVYLRAEKATTKTHWPDFRSPAAIQFHSWMHWNAEQPHKRRKFRIYKDFFFLWPWKNVVELFFGLGLNSVCDGRRGKLDRGRKYIQEVTLFACRPFTFHQHCWYLDRCVKNTLEVNGKMDLGWWKHLTLKPQYRTTGWNWKCWENLFFKSRR